MFIRTCRNTKSPPVLGAEQRGGLAAEAGRWDGPFSESRSIPNNELSRVGLGKVSRCWRRGAVQAKEVSKKPLAYFHLNPVQLTGPTYTALLRRIAADLFRPFRSRLFRRNVSDTEKWLSFYI